MIRQDLTKLECGYSTHSNLTISTENFVYKYEFPFISLTPELILKHSEEILKSEFPNQDRPFNIHFVELNLRLLDEYLERSLLFQADSEEFFKETVFNKFFNQFYFLNEMQFLFQKIEHQMKDKFERMDDVFTFRRLSGPIETVKRRFFEKSVRDNTQFAFLQLSPIFVLRILKFYLRLISLLI